MHTPIHILRKQAEAALVRFCASYGEQTPDEVWEILALAKERPDILEENDDGYELWDLFKQIREADVAALKNLVGV